MNFQPIKGVIVPTLTPFDDNGAVDLDKIEPLAQFLIEHGVKALFPLGTNGEGVLLSTAERKQVAGETVKAVGGALPVIVHTGAITTQETIELTQHAQDIGANAVAIVTPYYYPMAEEAIEQHYRTVIEAFPDMPIYLYNIPQCTGNRLSLDLVIRLVTHYENVVGLKDSSGDLQTLFATNLLQNGQFNTAIGPDELILAGVSMGLDAAVSGHANVVPEMVVGIYNATVAGNIEEAQKLQRNFNRVRSALSDPRNLSVWKGVLAYRGVPMGSNVRAPQLNASEETIKDVINRLLALGVLESK